MLSGDYVKFVGFLPISKCPTSMCQVGVRFYIALRSLAFVQVKMLLSDLTVPTLKWGTCFIIDGAASERSDKRRHDVTFPLLT
jgi:hypothetical protein